MHLALAFAVAAFGFLAVVLPLVRLWLRSGIQGFVGHRIRSPYEWLVGAGFVVANAVIGVGAAALAWLGPVRTGSTGLTLVWTPPPWVPPLGWALLAVGTSLVVIAQAQMGASWRIGVDPDGKTELVAHGLYSFSRHPIYGGVLVWFAGVVLTAPSAWSVAATLLGVVSVLAQVGIEETYLDRTHGEAYRAYARRVGRFGTLRR